MKKVLTHAVIALALFPALMKAQANSVLLKDGANTLITSHSSITDAYAAIPATLTQGYIIETTSSYNGATEVYPITFIAKTGASSTNTITLRPALGVSSQTIVTTIATANNGVIKLDDADYMVIDGRAGGIGSVGVLTFNNLSTASNGNTMVFINGACNNIVKYCTIMNSTTGNAGRNVFLAASASNVTGNSDNLFKYCTISGGRYQFNSNGTAANSNTRNIVFGCEFNNATFTGFWGQAGTAKVTIDSCSFHCTTATGGGLYFGIVFDSQKDSAIIKNNRMYDIQDLTVGVLRYIHVRSIAAGAANYTDIRNNFFSMMTGNASLTNIAMIELAGTGANARVVHNSFRVGAIQTANGTAGAVSSAGLVISSTSNLSVYEVKNNLFLNERSGGVTGVQHVAMSVESASPTFSINENTYNSLSGDLIRWGTTAYTTLSGYQGVVPGGEPNANTAPIQYYSTNNLHLSCANYTNALFMAPQIIGISTDIDYQARGTITYRGADEVTGPAPSLSVNSGTICTGTSFTITPSGSALSYSYSGGTNTVSPLITTSYTVTGIAANGCESTIVSTVTVNEPTVTVNSGNICVGTVFTITPSGAVNYTISGGSNTVAPVSSEDYTITGADAFGCENTAISSVTVSPLPSIAVNSGSICVGNSFTMVPSGAINYSYTGGSDIVSPTVTTDYTVTGYDANGCENTAVSSITVNALPAVTVNSGSVCEGNSFTMTPTGALNYTYSNGSNVVVPTANVSYTITGEDANGCENTAVSSIVVNPLPTVTVNSGTICSGKSFTLAASGAATYTYSGGSNVVSPTSNTTYVINGTDSNGCNGSATSSVTVNALPAVTLTTALTSVCVNDAPVVLAGLPAGGTLAGSGVSESNFIPATSGTFAVSYSYTNSVTGCDNTANVSITVGACTGLNQSTSLTGLQVYPNPNQGEFIIELANGAEKTIRLINLTGQVVFYTQSHEDKINLDIHHLSNGVYYCEIISESGANKFKLIKN